MAVASTELSRRELYAPDVTGSITRHTLVSAAFNLNPKPCTDTRRLNLGNASKLTRLVLTLLN